MSQGANIKVDGSAFRQRLEDALFSAEPSASALFLGAGREDLLLKLDHLIQFSELFLLICGPEGAGKSTLYHEFLSRREGTVGLSAIENSKALSPLKISQRIITASGGGELTPVAEPTQLLGLLEQYVHHPLLLVFDDAHELSGDCWSFLFELVEKANNSQVRIRVVAFADAFLDDALEKNIRHDRCHRLELQPLDGHSLEDYVALQQSHGRWPELGGLTEEARLNILRRTGGVLGVVDQLLQRDYDKIVAKSNRRLGLPKAHMWAVVGIATLLILSYLAQGLFQGSETVDNRVPLDDEVVPDNVVESAQPQIDSSQSSDQARQRLLAAAQQVVERQKSSSVAVVPPVESVLVEPSSKAALETSGLPETKIKAEAESVKPALIDVEAEVKKPEVPSSEAKQSVEPLETESTSKASVSKASATKPQADPAEKPEPAPKAQSKPVTLPTLSASQRWLLAQSPSAYSLQMLGGRQRQAVEAFIGRMGKGANWHLVETSHQGKAWYVALYGSYPSREAALAAVKSMSAALQAQKPWARALGPLQLEIKKP
ncbi:AAA family ATPase [Aestuariirhabdus sp. Z084]|uniref:AAA family ATPase n=1 Tax=Aestuariirhabdus haliotis TaxID=2918751 RepID=UPI00201B3D55|nr:AAA family ATPase [Aestuariirhabdus haliotis]MCL6414948.1 AAA family ATPase [Aestuariirhabdus haliotis]MCL6418880.1 AAA family ATPase [Aestuariirhabdus haliotis]